MTGFRLIPFIIVVWGYSMDMLSTFIVSPDLKHEQNPIFKRFGWPSIWAVTVLGCICGVIDQRAAVTIGFARALTGLSNMILVQDDYPKITSVFELSCVVIFNVILALGLGWWALLGTLAYLLMMPVFKFFS